jgi:hypothetical protein
LTQSEEGTVIEHKVSNKDFVQSSRWIVYPCCWHIIDLLVCR